MSYVRSIRKTFSAQARKFGIYSTSPLGNCPDIRHRIEHLVSDRDRYNALPSLDKAQVIEIKDNGCSNWVVVCGRKRNIPTRFVFFGGVSGNIIVLGERSDAPREIRFEGSDNLAICGNDMKWAQITMRFISSGAVISLGHGSIYNGTAVIVEGDGCGVEIGRECLFAPGTTIRTSDLHGMYDVNTGEWLNKPKPVVIEPHTWVGQDVLVLKGAYVGGGSVIAARAVVNSSQPRFAVVAGTPARAVRQGVSWSLSRTPEPSELEGVNRMLQRITDIDENRRSP